MRADKSISARTRLALQAAQRSGYAVILVSARPPRDVRGFADELGLTNPSICSNGAITYDAATHQVLRHERLSMDGARELANLLRGRLPELLFATDHGDKFGYEPGFPRFFEGLKHDHPPRVHDVAILCAEETTKLLVHHPEWTVERLADFVRGDCDALTVTHSGAGFIEIGAAGVTKAAGLSLHCADVRISPDEVIAFGDMPNDIPMLAFAGHGVAMANAHAEVLDMADEVAASNEEDGVAQIIERLLQAPRGMPSQADSTGFL